MKICTLCVFPIYICGKTPAPELRTGAKPEAKQLQSIKSLYIPVVISKVENVKRSTKRPTRELKLEKYEIKK